MTRHKRRIAFLNNLRSLRPQCISQRKRVARSINTTVHPWDASGATFLLTLVYSSSPSMSCCRNWWVNANNRSVFFKPLSIRHEITVSLLRAWKDSIIPLSVEGVFLEMKLLHGLLRDLEPYRVRVLIQLAHDLQARLGRRGRNEVDHHLVAHQRFPAPILADKGEEAMFDLVPLARPRGEVAHRDRHPRLICQPLEFQFP